MSTDQNKDVVRAGLERWNAGDLDGYMALYDPACVTHGLAPEPVDVAGLRAFYEMIYSAFSGPFVTLEDLVAEGDRVVIRYTFRGTHTGELMGVPASGADVVMSGMTMLAFRNGLAVERWQSTDLFGLMTQIGAIPAPATA
jgi:predicted ester cyclase